MDDEEKKTRREARKSEILGEPEFLDVGTTSWSILMALYILTLHDDSKTCCITFDSIKEMIENLKEEFGDMVPLVY